MAEGRKRPPLATSKSALPISPVAPSKPIVSQLAGIASLPHFITKPPLLCDADFNDAAASFGLDANVIRAVAEVESSGCGFDSAGRPKILFEAHLFHKFTKGKYGKTNPTVSQPTWNDVCKRCYKLDQWIRLDEAMRLDREAALKSVSWGAFQVMGFNHSGFDTLDLFVNAMFISEGEHLKSFLSFCRDNALILRLKNKDWAGFAKAYNGPGYAANRYDTKMQKAYTRISSKSTATTPR